MHTHISIIHEGQKAHSIHIQNPYKWIAAVTLNQYVNDPLSLIHCGQL